MTTDDIRPRRQPPSELLPEIDAGQARSICEGIERAFAIGPQNADVSQRTFDLASAFTPACAEFMITWGRGREGLVNRVRAGLDAADPDVREHMDDLISACVSALASMAGGALSNSPIGMTTHGVAQIAAGFTRALLATAAEGPIVLAHTDGTVRDVQEAGHA